MSGQGATPVAATAESDLVPLTVIVAYGSPDLTEQCVQRFGRPDRLVVVDNARDDDVRAIADRVGARYLRPERNIGFAAGVNVALRAARCHGEHVLLLNPDALVTSEQAASLVRALERGPGRVAAVAPRLRGRDGRSQRTVWPLPTPGRVWLGAVGLGNLRARCSFLSGAVLLLSGAALDDVGEFDERYFLYAEETDWQRRALNAGWNMSVVAEVEIEHAGGATSSSTTTREILFHASAEVYFRKWHGRAGWTVARSGALVAAVRRAVAGERGQLGVARLYLRGPRRVARVLARSWNQEELSSRAAGSAG